MTSQNTYSPHRLAALFLVLAVCATPAAFAQVAPQSTPPAPLPERPVEFPAFEELRLPNGLPLLVVEHHGQPIVHLNLYVRAGETADPADQAGRAGLVAEVLTKGTPTRSAAEIAETIEDVGARLSASAGRDWMTVSTTVLTEHVGLAFDLLREVALEPTFPESEVALARRRTLSGLQAQLGQPATVADRQFARVLYGEHPYGIAAVPGTVESLTRDDLVAFHEANFAPENALLVVSGAISASEAEALAQQHFSGWRATAQPAPGFTRTPVRDETRIYLVHRPGTVQSSIRIGHLATRPGHPDHFALQVLNHIIGGPVEGRLFQILREEKGWTYGANTRFTQPLDVGNFAVVTESRTEVTDSSLVEILHQLRRLRDEAIPQEEFDAAVSFLAGSFPLRIETPGQIAAQVAQARLLGLSPDDVTQYRQRILAVTPEDVRRVAREHVHPDRSAIVIVGDATQLLPRLDGIAPITLYDIEGRELDRAALEVRGTDERFDATRLRERTATYQFLVQGNPMGTVTDRLAREGGAWVSTTTIESPVMGQQIELRFGATDFAPDRVDQEVRQGPMTIRTNLQVEAGRIVGRAELPEQMGGPRDIDVEMVEGTLLPGMETHVLAAAGLEEGRSLTLPIFNTMTNSVMPTTFEVRGVEEITVPAGTFSAFRVQVAGAVPMTLYLRQEAPHLMLRQEFAGQPIVIELQSVE